LSRYPSRACFVIITIACLTPGCSRNPDSVRLAVGGQAALRFFPVYLARELGLYDQQGLRVTIADLSGSAKAMQALMGGSADVAAGFYDQTIQMAGEGRRVRSFVTLTRYLGFVAAVAPGTKKKIARVEDLKGAVVGVAAPGSSGHLLLNYLLVSHGLAPSDVSVYSIGTGGSSVAAMKRGTVDAGFIGDLVLEPLLREKPNLTILVDTRSEAGLRQTFGVSTYPGSVLYASGEWLDSHHDAAGRLARAMQTALRWAREHSAEQTLEKLQGVYQVEDRSILLEALRSTIGILSPDGVMPADAPEAVKRVLSVSIEKVRNAKIDPASTYTNEFVRGN
jgi:NitT/TauT family transport system substrate-binding protein